MQKYTLHAVQLRLRRIKVSICCVCGQRRPSTLPMHLYSSVRNGSEKNDEYIVRG